ncbi:MAG: hypothetical protein JW395_3601 [Nitrospira sp.]|nr:hypothetical protein [Nitrospira sp.]
MRGSGGDGQGSTAGIAMQIEQGLSNRRLEARIPPVGPTGPSQQVHLVRERSKVYKVRQHTAQQQQAQFRNLEDPDVVQRGLKCGCDLRELLRCSGRQGTELLQIPGRRHGCKARRCRRLRRWSRADACGLGVAHLSLSRQRIRVWAPSLTRRSPPVRASG